MTVTVAIIGCGLIGRSWAVSFLRAGYRVRVFDSDPDAMHEAALFVRLALQELGTAKLVDHDPEALANELENAPDLDTALAGVDYVQESTVEDVSVKRTVLSEIDRHAPETAVIASSSSFLAPSAFTRTLECRERCLVAHPLNPPHVVPAVELVPAPWTAPETMDHATDVLEGAGQSCIRMNKEIEGFVMNRLQAVVIEEAFQLVAQGYAGIDDVDRAMRDGLGLRWSFMGPFETVDLNAPKGLRDYVARYGERHRAIAHDRATDLPWDEQLLARMDAERRERLPLESIPARQAWRDRRLVALAAHKRAQSAEES